MFYGVAFFTNNTLDHVDDVFETENSAKTHASLLNRRFKYQDGDYYSVIRLMILPPDGWSVFGTHVDYSGEIEFTKELDFDGYPLGERPFLTRDRGRDRMTG